MTLQSWLNGERLKQKDMVRKSYFVDYIQNNSHNHIRICVLLKEANKNQCLPCPIATLKRRERHLASSRTPCKSQGLKDKQKYIFWKYFVWSCCKLKKEKQTFVLFLATTFDISLSLLRQCLFFTRLWVLAWTIYELYVSLSG